HGVPSTIDRARNTVDRAGSTALGVWITDDGAPGTAQGVCGTVEDAPRVADRESDGMGGDWNRGRRVQPRKEGAYQASAGAGSALRLRRENCDFISATSSSSPRPLPAALA